MTDGSRPDDQRSDHGRVVVVGDAGVADDLAVALDAPVGAVEDVSALHEQDGVACVVVDGATPDPPGAVPAPVVAYVDADPETLPETVDDFVRRDGVDRLADRVRWHLERTPPPASQHSKVEQLHDIASELLACRDETGVYELVVSAAERILEFDICGVDAVEDGWLVPKAVSAEMAEVGYQRAPVEEAGVAGRAVLTGTSIVVDEAGESEVADPVDSEYRSGLTVPIGETAVFQAAAREPDAFDEADRELAELLAAHAEGTLRRIRSERAVHRRRETIERLHATATKLMTSESERELCELLVEAAERLLDFRVSVALTDDAGDDRLRVRAASDDELAPPVDHSFDAGEGIAGHSYETGEAVVLDDASDSDLADPYDDRYRSAISVPMGDVGVFQAISTEAGTFDQQELELAEFLVAQAGVVVRRLRAERRLVGERDRLIALFKNIPDPAISSTLEDGRPVVRDVNDAFEETFGYGAEEVVGESIDELIVPEGFREEAESFNDQVRQGETARETTRRRTADGELRDFLVHLVPVHRGASPAGFAIYTDITDRRRRERAVTELHEATRRLVSANDREEIAEITTQAAREVLGFALSGVRLVEDGTLEPVSMTDERVERMGDPPTYDLDDDAPPPRAYQSESMLTFQDGEVDSDDDQDRESLGAAVYLPLGDHGTLSVATAESRSIPEADRTLIEILAGNTTVALDRLEQEHRAREREAELQRQNERLEEFASAVSHDLRSPLSVARGRLQLVRETGDEESLEAIAEAHERMDALIDDLLTLARQGQVVGETTAVELERIARDAWGTADTFGADLEVADPGTVEADPDRLVQLLTNLFRNAAEHAGEEPRVSVGSLPDGFYVADDGPGIPEGERGKVFERGYTTDDDGTGFGLAIVEEIADAHGWDVRVVESDEGGARFEITGVEMG